MEAGLWWRRGCSGGGVVVEAGLWQRRGCGGGGL